MVGDALSARSVIPIDENYLIMTRGVVACYEGGLKLNYEDWAMSSAIPSLLAEVERLRGIIDARKLTGLRNVAGVTAAPADPDVERCSVPVITGQTYRCGAPWHTHRPGVRIIPG